MKTQYNVVLILSMFMITPFSANADIITFFEGFHDEIIDGRNEPDQDIGIDLSLSTVFSDINEGFSAWPAQLLFKN